jgi:hypothetical protein
MIMDNRYYSRISFVADAEVFVDGMRYPAEMLDLSLRGTLLNLESAGAVDIGMSYPLKIHLPSSDITIRFDAELVHKNGNYAGFRFQSLDVESMTHLRKMLDLNTGNHAKLTDEMEFWLSQ